MQLQQVILNLLINATEAMSGMSEGPRELLISTTKTDSEGVLVAVRDWGPGLAPSALTGCSVLLHDQTWRLGNGAVDLPLDH